MPIGITNIHIQINVSELINKIVSFLFWEFNGVASFNEGKTIFLDLNFKFPHRNTGFIFKDKVCQCKHVFP